MSNKDNMKNTLSNDQWSCAICDLGHISSQLAGTARDLEKEGMVFENQCKDAKRTYGRSVRRWCGKCEAYTTQYKLR